MIKNIFSVPIYIENNIYFLDESLKAFDNFGIEKYYAPNLYGVSGFTTYFNQESSNVIKKLVPNTIKFLEDNSYKYLDKIGYDLSDHNIEVETLWFSEMKENSSHSFHTHSTLGNKTLMLCGTYYLSIPENSCPITFSRSEGEFFNQVNLPVKENNSYTARFFDYLPKNGDLVLFLVETFHGVLANKNKEGRKTLSFNVEVKKHAT